MLQLFKLFIILGTLQSFANIIETDVTDAHEAAHYPSEIHDSDLHHTNLYNLTDQLRETIQFKFARMRKNLNQVDRCYMPAALLAHLRRVEHYAPIMSIRGSNISNMQKLAVIAMATLHKPEDVSRFELLKLRVDSGIFSTENALAHFEKALAHVPDSMAPQKTPYRAAMLAAIRNLQNDDNQQNVLKFLQLSAEFDQWMHRTITAYAKTRHDFKEEQNHTHEMQMIHSANAARVAATALLLDHHSKELPQELQAKKRKTRAVKFVK